MKRKEAAISEERKKKAQKREEEEEEDAAPGGAEAAVLEEGDSDSDSSILEGFESPADDPPEQKKKKNKKSGALTGGSEDSTASSGTLYVGRIPHGFYEEEMRSYFSQFGEITRLRISRNRKSGASKHYGFIEFKTKGVADIVQDTMDNYLLFNHILKVKHVPAERIHEDFWVGANKKFKTLPQTLLSRRKNDGEKNERQLARIKGRAEKKRTAKVEQLKSLGVDYDLPVHAASIEPKSKSSLKEKRGAKEVMEGEPVTKTKAKKRKGVTKAKA